MGLSAKPVADTLRLRAKMASAKVSFTEQGADSTIRADSRGKIKALLSDVYLQLAC